MVIPVAVVAAVLVSALAGMVLGWRRRGGAQRRLVPPAAPADAGPVRAEADGLYLSTTFAGRPLERVVAGGLGYRARAHLAVVDAGVLLERDGAGPLLLPVEKAGTATWTIDRAVEPGGLLVLGWSLPSADGGAEAVESSIRLEAADQAGLLAALESVRPSEVPRADPPA